MTSIWLAGAENPAHHSLFRMADVDRVAVNVGSWKRNYSKDWSLRDDYEPVEWIAWTDSPASVDDLLEVTDAIGFAPVAAIGSPEWTNHPNYMEVWNGEGQLPVTIIGGGLVVTDAVFSDKTLNKRALGSKKRDLQLGVITGKSKGLERYDFVISSAWWSAQKHGETQLWDGSHLHRVNATTKMKFRNEHLEDIRELGVNEFDVLDDDPTAVAVLALASWMAYGDELGGDKDLDIVKSEADITTIDQMNFGASSSQALATPTQRTRNVLPSMEAVEFTDPETGQEHVAVGSTSRSLRRCDNCFLASNCPAFSAGAECAYEIPVKLRSKDDLNNVMTAMMEVQIQRVFQSRFAEETTGQELDKSTGQELERAFKLIEQFRDITDNRDSLSISIESRGEGGGGVLSQLFGNTVGEAAKQLDEPIDAEAVIESIDP